MLKPTLTEFLARPKELDNSYLAARGLGFAELYVRKSYRLIDKERRYVFVIATVEATEPGNGAFRRLVDGLHPLCNLYVECVLNPDLATHLLERGFTKDPLYCDISPCFYLLQTAALLPGRVRQPA